MEAIFEDIRIHRGKEGLVASLDQKTTDGIGTGTKILLLHEIDVSKKVTYKFPKLVLSVRFSIAFTRA